MTADHEEQHRGAGADDPRSTLVLIVDLIRGASALVGKEIALARAETAEAARRLALGAGLVILAVLLALTAINVLAAAAAAGLVSAGVSPWQAALIVGGGLAGLGVFALWLGLRVLRRTSLAPRRTLASVQADVAALRESLDDR